jgi:hypothetical protein
VPKHTSPDASAKKSKCANDDDNDTTHAEKKCIGVHRTKSGLKWQAKISIGGKSTFLGTFDTQEAAARRYDEKATRLGRPLNFPNFSENEASDIKSDGEVAQGDAERPLVDATHERRADFFGVAPAKDGGWQASIPVDGKLVVLGVFPSAIDAALKYDRSANRLGRPLNFPKNPSTDGHGAAPTEDEAPAFKFRRKWGGVSRHVDIAATSRAEAHELNRHAKLSFVERRIDQNVARALNKPKSPAAAPPPPAAASVREVSVCERCSASHDGTYGSGRFCSKVCGRSHGQPEARAPPDPPASSGIPVEEVCASLRPKKGHSRDSADEGGPAKRPNSGSLEATGDYGPSSMPGPPATSTNPAGLDGGDPAVSDESQRKTLFALVMEVEMAINGEVSSTADGSLKDRIGMIEFGLGIPSPKAGSAEAESSQFWERVKKAAVECSISLYVR